MGQATCHFRIQSSESLLKLNKKIIAAKEMTKKVIFLKQISISVTLNASIA